MIWKRRGAWAAHLYLVDGQQFCNRAHGTVPGSAPLVQVLKSDCTPQGIPYGRVCRICQRVWIGQPRGT